MNPAQAKAHLTVLESMLKDVEARAFELHHSQPEPDIGSLLWLSNQAAALKAAITAFAATESVRVGA